MALTQRDYAAQMVAQLRLLDPTISADIGTPERKIIDAIAQALADSSVDLSVLQGSLDLDSKFGSNLDRFVSLFGFGRQTARHAEGFVTFGRITPSLTDVVIRAGTRVQAVVGNYAVVFFTTFDVVLPAGELDVLVPVRAAVAGTSGNVGAGTIVAPVDQTISGITRITNPEPITGGLDAEDDDSLKVRFKNTIFRNLAGTEDQFLALAASSAYTTKANIVGPISRYQEYVQVPQFDDATAYDITGDSIEESGNGSPNEYTSALSSIPYSKYTYEDVPLFVSNGQLGVGSIFYRRDMDYRINFDPADKNKGDTYRLYMSDRGLNPLTDSKTTFQPNLTFTNVYTGTNASISAIRPNQVVLFEHSYLSTASRNDIERSITNCVDIYVDGGNFVTATSILTSPTSANLFINDPASKFHYDNYRRKGQPDVRPRIGNLLTPLLFQPVAELPPTIEVTSGGHTYTFTEGVHYWAVEDTSILQGSIRARSGIEWNMDARAPSGTTSNTLLITDPGTGLQPTTINVVDYVYDKSIPELQATMERSKQVTTDVLVHRARRRYFKLDVTVMYVPGASVTETNTAIRDVVQRELLSRFFGSPIQLSDLLQTIHSVPQVDNVRWSSDVPGAIDRFRMYETDEFGRPLVNVNVRRRRSGGTVAEIQEIVLGGNPTAGNFALSYQEQYTTPLPYNATGTTVRTALNAILPGGVTVSTVTGTGTSSDPYVVTFGGTSAVDLLDGTPNPAKFAASGTVPLVNGQRDLYSTEYIINNDFYLKDDELPSLATVNDVTTPGAEDDTVPGMIIRPRAQGTWLR